jgi:hypothetical protein
MEEHAIPIFRVEELAEEEAIMKTGGKVCAYHLLMVMNLVKNCNPPHHYMPNF